MGYLEGFGVTHPPAPPVRRQAADEELLRRAGGPEGAEGPQHGEPATGWRRRTRPTTSRAPKPDRLHGRHVLNRYEDGMEKCIGCELCAGVCPAKCIYVRGADNDPDNPTSPGERFGFVYEINYLRCIHCDLCVEACPTEAITETQAVRVLVHQPPRRRSTPRTSCSSATTASRSTCRGRTGARARTLTTSGWVRATAPSGDADFVGQVGWSGELGYGVRAPEEPAP